MHDHRLPAQWIYAQPRIRSRQDDYRLVVQLAWTDGEHPQVTPSVRVVVGEDDELVSEFVGAPISTEVLYLALTDIAADAVAWVRRTRDPFDDLV